MAPSRKGKISPIYSIDLCCYLSTTIRVRKLARFFTTQVKEPSSNLRFLASNILDRFFYLYIEKREEKNN